MPARRRAARRCTSRSARPISPSSIAVDDDPLRLAARAREPRARRSRRAAAHRRPARRRRHRWRRRSFDRVLVDAPCSATGVIRRHPDIKLLRRPTDIEAFAATQQRILRTAFELLRPGGRLVYCTCSVLPAENEERGRVLPGRRTARRRRSRWPKGCRVRRASRTRSRLAVAAGWRCGHRWLLLCVPAKYNEEIEEPDAVRARALPRLTAVRALLASVGAGPARADALDGLLEVRSAYVNVEAGRVPVVRARGISRERRHPRGAQGWPYADLRPRRRGHARTPLLDGRDRRGVYAASASCSYHAVSDRYVTRDVDRSSAANSTATPRSRKRSRRWARWMPGRSCSRRSCRRTASTVCSLRAGVRRGRLPGYAARADLLDRRLAPRERVVLMVPAALRRLGTLGLIALWVLVSGGLLLLLALCVQNSVQYSKLQAWILLINAIAVVTRQRAAGAQDLELVRAFRAQVPGSRLTARTVAIFGSLVVAPLIIVYLFSLEFLNRGIDSWFKVEIKQGLDRRARPVEVRRWTCACANTRAAPSCSRTGSPTARSAAGPLATDTAARRERRARSRRVRHARPGARGEQRGPASRSNLPRYASGPEISARDRGRQLVLEPGAAVGWRLPDQHRGTDRGRAGIERRSLRGGDLSGAATTRATFRRRAALAFSSTRELVDAPRSREEQFSH